MSAKRDEEDRKDQIGHIPAPGGYVSYLRHKRLWNPPADMIESENQFFVIIEIAGMEDGQIEVTLMERRLMVRGVRPPRDLGTESEHFAFHQLEVNYGEFQTEVSLPWPIDEKGIDARYHDGFLVIRCPRAQQKKVQITQAENEQDKEVR